MTRTPEEVVEELRAIREDLGDEFRGKTAQERRDLRNRTKSSPELIEASASAIGMSDLVAAAIGTRHEQVHELIMADKRWAYLESEVRQFLNEVSSARLARRYQLDFIATRTFAVVKQLIRSPENEPLVSIFNEMQAIRKKERRKKRAPKAEPEPQP